MRSLEEGRTRTCAGVDLEVDQSDAGTMKLEAGFRFRTLEELQGAGAGGHLD